MAHWKGNNESWDGRVLGDLGGDSKQEIYFAWPNVDCHRQNNWGYQIILHPTATLKCGPSGMVLRI